MTLEGICLKEYIWKYTFYLLALWELVRLASNIDWQQTAGKALFKGNETCLPAPQLTYHMK